MTLFAILTKSSFAVNLRAFAIAIFTAIVITAIIRRFALALQKRIGGRGDFEQTRGGRRL